jgi:hypothetical protein
MQELEAEGKGPWHAAARISAGCAIYDNELLSVL